MVANTDGTGERKVATRKLPAYFGFAGGPAWSPDGKTIACGAGSYSGNLSATIVAVPAEGGPETVLLHKILRQCRESCGSVMAAD